MLRSSASVGPAHPRYGFEPRRPTMGSTPPLDLTIRIIVGVNGVVIHDQVVTTLLPETALPLDEPVVESDVQVMFKAPPRIRTQQLPTLHEIAEKLSLTPIYAYQDSRRTQASLRMITAEELSAVFHAYRNTSTKSRWYEMFESSPLPDSELFKALDMFGLGRRHIVTTDTLVCEAYRLSLHGIAVDEISSKIGLDPSKVQEKLNWLQDPSRVGVQRIESIFTELYGLTPEKYAETLRV